KANVWASGPIVRDRLFLFAMYEARDSDSKYSSTGGGEWFRGEASDGFWGAKMDWRVNDDHLLELLAFSDETETGTSTYAYDWDTGEVGGLAGGNTVEGGGKSGSLTYTGYF